MATLRKLTARERRFVDEYLVDLNATQAAIRAGYAKAGAHVQGTRLFKNPSVVAAVKSAIDTRAVRTEITADRVLQELAVIGFGAVRDVVKLGALDKLGRHLGLWDRVQKLELSGDPERPVQVQVWQFGAKTVEF